MLTDQPELTVDGQCLNHRIQIHSAAVLSLSQDSNLFVKIPNLFVLLIPVRKKISVINIKYFYGDDLPGRLLAATAS